MSVVFAAKNKLLDQPLNIHINGTSIAVVDSTKFLGVWIDKQLSWQMHVNELSKKLRRVCGIVNRYKYTFTYKIKKMLYHSLLLSNIQYCLLIYGTAYATHLERILKMQKFFLRMLHLLEYRAPTALYFYKNRFLPVDLLYKYNLLKIFKLKKYKNVKERLINLSQLTEVVHVYATRAPEKYFVPTPSREYSKQKLSYQLPTLLNTYDTQNRSLSDIISDLLSELPIYIIYFAPQSTEHLCNQHILFYFLSC